MSQYNFDDFSSIVLFVKEQVRHQVLPFWLNNVIDPSGGLFGEVSAEGLPKSQAERGVILHARALWSFSVSYKNDPNPGYLKAAQSIYHYLVRHFWDAEFGGVYWSVDYNGEPLDSTKRLIAQAYFLFSLAAYSQVDSDDGISEKIAQLTDILAVKFKTNLDYYHSHLDREMKYSVLVKPIIEVCPHLHVLEALLEVARCCPAYKDSNEVRYLVDWFLKRVFPVQSCMTLEFTMDWKVYSPELSYGHNYESAWLVYEAAAWLKDDALMERAKTELIRLVDFSLAHCSHSSSAVNYGVTVEGQPTQFLAWWPQTEASNALLLAYTLTGREEYSAALKKLWSTIPAYWVDERFGEWHTQLDLSMQSLVLEKAGLWRCSYHTVRACWRMSQVNSGIIKNPA